MRAAVKALQNLGPAKIIVAAPVTRVRPVSLFRPMWIQRVCVMSPEPFQGVGLWYRDFSQTTDEEVCYLLNHAKGPPRKHAA